MRFIIALLKRLSGQVPPVDALPPRPPPDAEPGDEEEEFDFTPPLPEAPMLPPATKGPSGMEIRKDATSDLDLGELPPDV